MQKCFLTFSSLFTAEMMKNTDKYLVIEMQKEVEKEASHFVVVEETFMQEIYRFKRNVFVVVMVLQKQLESINNTKIRIKVTQLDSQNHTY